MEDESTSCSVFSSTNPYLPESEVDSVAAMAHTGAIVGPFVLHIPLSQWSASQFPLSQVPLSEVPDSQVLASGSQPARGRPRGRGHGRRG